MRVGADMTAFLPTGPEGHILIDGGFPATAPTPHPLNARPGSEGCRTVPLRNPVH